MALMVDKRALEDKVMELAVRIENLTKGRTIEIKPLPGYGFLKNLIKTIGFTLIFTEIRMGWDGEFFTYLAPERMHERYIEALSFIADNDKFAWDPVPEEWYLYVQFSNGGFLTNRASNEDWESFSDKEIIKVEFRTR
jgi:hypothetical protein